MRCPFALTVALVACLAFAGPAVAQTWTGAANDGVWNTVGNWSPAVVPNSPAADVTFGNTGVRTVTLRNGVTARSLRFANSTGSYILTSTDAAIAGLTAITVTADVTATQTISLAKRCRPAESCSAAKALRR